MNRKLMRMAGLTITLTWATWATAQERSAPPVPPRLPSGVSVVRDLSYIEGGHERNRLDLYLPDKIEGQLPLLVWVHGGAWQAGSKDRPPMLSLVAKGFALASINYRLSQHAPFPAQIQDCKAAVRWLRANARKYHIDSCRVGVLGGSAGGHLVALLGLTAGVKEWESTGGNLDQSNRVQCVVDWYGRTDLTMASSQNNPSVTSSVSQLLGGAVDENQDKALKGSPLHYVHQGVPPFLIVHGDQDPRVPLKQSELLADALKKAGAEVTLFIVKGGGHGGSAFNAPEVSQTVERFLAEHLVKAK